MLTFRFTGADGAMTVAQTLTSGMVGQRVSFLFSEEWDGLTKTAVFSAGDISRDVLNVTDGAVIPAEVLSKPMQRLYVGVYGVGEDGARVTPTVRAQGPWIEPGADPSGDLSTEPDLPVWAQIQQQLEEVKAGGVVGSVPADSKFASITIGDVEDAGDGVTIVSAGTSAAPRLSFGGAADGAAAALGNIAPGVEAGDAATVAQLNAGIAAALPQPGNTAAAGQYIMVSAVDEAGHVTATEAADLKYQDKSVVPTSLMQRVTPDEGYAGLSSVTVGAVSDESGRAYQTVSAENPVPHVAQVENVLSKNTLAGNFTVILPAETE